MNTKTAYIMGENLKLTSQIPIVFVDVKSNAKKQKKISILYDY